MSFSVLGTGMYVPENIVTNDDLSKLVETSDEWISQRVGVRQRRIATTETAADMAYEAAKNALENSGCRAEELDLILAATVSGETASPSVACMVQHLLGADCMAYDISAACSAFIFLLETAAGYFARKKVRKVLVVGAERLSRIIDWTDRSTCVIFGDGAGAAVLGEGEGYLDSTFTVRGGDDVIKIPNYIGSSPFYRKEAEKPYIHMNGQETFKYAVNAISADVRNLLERSGLALDEIRYIIPHQANKRIIDSAAKRLGAAKEKFFINIERYGNTSSASIPIALDEMNRSGMLQRGDKLILTAFGGGLANAACLLKW
ncbi:MAG: ketoacyl-ACP synthase III [Firmicutes bacterium]|nr:ketoacyl-ACP synthase III [Bacillota bacterium]